MTWKFEDIVNLTVWKSILDIGIMKKVFDRILTKISLQFPAFQKSPRSNLSTSAYHCDLSVVLTSASICLQLNGRLSCQTIFCVPFFIFFDTPKCVASCFYQLPTDHDVFWRFVKYVCACAGKWVYSIVDLLHIYTCFQTILFTSRQLNPNLFLKNQFIAFLSVQATINF